MTTLRTLIALGAIALAGGASARAGGDAEFDRILKGKQPGAPERCIIPDLSAQPVILDGRAIAYFSGSTVYVNRFGAAGCAPLRQSRRLVTEGIGGRLCRDDPARVIEPTGGTGYGFCTLGDFTPYAKAR